MVPKCRVWFESWHCVKNWYVVVMERYQVMGYKQLQRGYYSVLPIMMFTFLYARLQASCLHIQVLWGCEQTIKLSRLMWQCWSELEPKMDTVVQQTVHTDTAYWHCSINFLLQEVTGDYSSHRLFWNVSFSSHLYLPYQSVDLCSYATR
jgi:hypothetical protein